MKRQHHQGSGDRQEYHKKHKHDHSNHPRYPTYGHQSSSRHPSNSSSYTSNKNNKKEDNTSERSYGNSYDTSNLPPPTATTGEVSSYTPFTVPNTTNFPALPPIKQPHLQTAPFTHRSTLGAYNRGPQISTANADMTYEKLEFLGDAYIELIASRLIFCHYAHLTAGQQSQLRELLVKNETLAEFSRAYGFEQRVSVGDMAGMVGSVKGNKGFNKILGDVFEAYVAAVVLSDSEEGMSVAEKWLQQLWTPKLLEATKKDASYVKFTHDESADPRSVYNPTAKQELQQRIVDHQVTKLEYEPYKAMVELEGDQLGQNRHFIALYLTGYGCERKLLGKGEGKNKAEAGNWAAVEAMHGEAKGIVEECEGKLKAIREERKKAKEAVKLKDEEGA